MGKNPLNKKRNRIGWKICIRESHEGPLRGLGLKKMDSEPKNTNANSQPSENRKKGWWGRFLERLAKANAESSAVACRH